MKLRLLMSQCRKTQRDKVIGKQWVYFREKHTLQNMGYLRRWVQLGNVILLAFTGWVISRANNWEDYSNHFGEGVEISKNWPLTFGLWWSAFGTVMVLMDVSFILLAQKVSFHTEELVEVYFSAVLGPLSSVYAVSFSQRFALSPAVLFNFESPFLGHERQHRFQLSRFPNLFLACKIWSSTGFFLFW